MQNRISVYIEMPVYLKKYLIGQSANKKEPIEFPTNHDYNIILTRLASNDNTIHPVDTSLPHAKIHLPFTALKNVYFYNKLSRESRAAFREQVRLDFYYDLRLFLKDMIMSGEERKLAIETFFYYYKITDDDVNYQSFYRNFTRYNEKKRASIALTILHNCSRKNVQRLSVKT